MSSISILGIVCILAGIIIVVLIMRLKLRKKFTASPRMYRIELRSGTSDLFPQLYDRINKVIVTLSDRFVQKPITETTPSDLRHAFDSTNGTLIIMKYDADAFQDTLKTFQMAEMKYHMENPEEMHASIYLLFEGSDGKVYFAVYRVPSGNAGPVLGNVVKSVENLPFRDLEKILASI